MLDGQSEDVSHSTSGPFVVVIDLEVGAGVVVVVGGGAGVVVVVGGGAGLVVEGSGWTQNSGPVPQFPNEEQHSFLLASQVSSATQHPTPWHGGPPQNSDPPPQ